MSALPLLRIGTAGWNIPKQSRERFPAEGSHLERYASIFDCVEINSSFYRPHRPATYERWAASTPAGFRFSLKIPREITHKRKLGDFQEPLAAFLSETAHLGEKLGVYVVQLPPSLALDVAAATEFFTEFRRAYAGGIACEPRHPSWFSAQGSTLLRQLNVTRIGADPEPAEGAGRSEPFGRFGYFRWHGSPRVYYSAYDEDRLRTFAVLARETGAPEVWCIFDNTAFGEATGNAIATVSYRSSSR